MFKLRLPQFVAAVVLTFSLLANFAFGIGVCTAFAHGGLKGVTGWINHITYEGSWRTTEVSHVYLRFVLNWLFIIGLACASFYLFRFCTRRIQAKERRA